MTTMDMMLLFTWSSRIRRENVGRKAIVFKKLSFGPFTLKRKFSFQTKTGSAAFLKDSVFEGGEHRSSVKDRRNRSKS